MSEPRTELSIVGVRAGATTFRVESRRKVPTLEGKLAGTRWVDTRVGALGIFALITMGELATVTVSPKLAVAIHACVLAILITGASVVRRLNPALSHLFIALSPVPLIRIASLTAPLTMFSYVQWFMIIAVVLYSGIVTVLRFLRPRLDEIGLKFPARKDWWIEALVILGGFGLGWTEYQILHPGAIIQSLTWRNLLAPIITIYIATGLLEEILFRGIIQRYAIKGLGPLLGIALSVALFGVMHVGWQSWWDILFVSAVGLVYSLVVRRTGSIIGVSISHGITNSMLFLIMPFLQG